MDGLKKYLASLIECIDDFEAGNSPKEMLAQLEELMNDPPGIASLAPDHKIRRDLSVIRAKYFFLMKDIDRAKSHLGLSE